MSDPSDTHVPPAFAAALQRVVDAEHAVGDEPCLLRVEVPSLGLVSRHASGTLQRRAEGVEAIAATPDSPFRIASVTKPFTSVLVAQLVAEVRLSFDDRLVDYAMSPSYGKALFLDPGHAWTPHEMIEGAIAWGEPHFPPGEGYGYAYADTGYVLAGVVVEALDGRPLWQSYRERILDPLGMTGTYLEGFEAHRGPAVSHAHEGEYDVMVIHGSSDWAGGGLVSTLDELAVFAQALVAGRALRDPELSEILHWQFRTLDPALHSPGYLGYGMGVEARDLAGHVFRGHRGHWGVLMHVDPISGVTITGTINQSSRRPDALAQGAVAAIVDHLPSSVWEPRT